MSDPARAWREQRDRLRVEREKLAERTSSDLPSREVEALHRDLTAQIEYAERKIAEAGPKASGESRGD